VLNFKLGKILAYAVRSGANFEKASREFFAGLNPYPGMPNEKEISPLFNEWFIFDYRLPSGITWAMDYYARNPDQLPALILDELKQIIETQVYDFVEVEKVNPGKWVEVYSLPTGKRYRVTEIMLSLGLGERRGCFFNRLAKVNGQYYFVGSDPAFLPVTYTERSKKFFLKQRSAFSPKDALAFWLPKEGMEKPDDDLGYLQQKGGLLKKRRELALKFKSLRKKYPVKLSFRALVDFVYQEKYKDHFADFHIDLISKLGIPEEMVFTEVKFFQDLWNFFPHKVLGGRSPAERFKEARGI